MLHLTYGTSFLLLVVFLISSILHHQPALIHHHALTPDTPFTFLVSFFTVALKRSFSQSFLLHRHLSLPQADLLEFAHSLFNNNNTQLLTRRMSAVSGRIAGAGCLAVIGGWRRCIGKSGRLIQRTIFCIYLFIYNQILHKTQRLKKCEKNHKSPSADEIPERDVTYYLTYLPLNYDTPVFCSEIFLK